jgi:hypothetical protein
VSGNDNVRRKVPCKNARAAGLRYCPDCEKLAGNPKRCSSCGEAFTRTCTRWFTCENCMTLRATKLDLAPYGLPTSGRVS